MRLPITKKEFEELEADHRAIWEWLAKTGEGKDTLPPELSGKYKFSCPACSLNLVYATPNCSLCPITWETEKSGAKEYFCQQYGSLYETWRNLDEDLTLEERKSLALKISELPWTAKPGVLVEAPG